MKSLKIYVQNVDYGKVIKPDDVGSVLFKETINSYLGERMRIHFDNFMESRETGKFIINPFWLEYLLNLFHQGYYREIWEEMMDTRCNLNQMIKRVAFSTIEKGFR